VDENMSASTVRSAERTVRVLEFLSTRRGPTPTMIIASHCGIPKSSTHNLLNVLRGFGWVEYERPARAWAIGGRFREMGVGLPLLTDALLVLKCFDGRSHHQAVDGMAQRTGLLPDTVSRIILLLEREGFIARSPDGSYRLGLYFVSLAGQMGSLERLRVCSRPFLTALRDLTGETATLVVKDGDFSVCVEQVESLQPLRHTGWIGKRVALAGTATGAAIQAAQGAQVAEGAVEPGVTTVACNTMRLDPPVVVAITGPSFRLSGDSLGRACSSVEDTARLLAEKLAAVALQDSAGVWLEGPLPGG